MILYEHPFNERIRTYLRLEHLLGRLAQLVERDTPLDHHFALVTLFDVMEVTSRSDLKSDVLKDLEKQKAYVSSFRDNPGISQKSLDKAIQHIDHAFAQLKAQHIKPGHDLLEIDWLMSLRNRCTIPGGTCQFDLPVYHAWQMHPISQRHADLARWTASLAPMAQAIGRLLQMLRDSATSQRVQCDNGQYQKSLNGRSYQLLRLRVPSPKLIPEISGNRLMVYVRLLHQDDSGKLQPWRDTTHFELSLCA